MPRISPALYQGAMALIMQSAGYQYELISKNKFIVHKSNRSLYVDASGRNLPYYDRNSNKEGFSWETYISLKRLQTIEEIASEHEAESWIAYCYAIFGEKYIRYFSITIKLEDKLFGAKFIRTSTFRKYMQERSPNAWDVLNIPKDKVPILTLNPEDI